MSSHKPQLIILYGFAGVGKTTLAKRLNQEIPFSLRIEEDELLNLIGQWLLDESTAREYVYLLIKSMVHTYLKLGHDVILPYLLLDKNHALDFDQITHTIGASLTEMYLHVEKHDAIEYLYHRGTWGEMGSPPISQADMPHIQEIYDTMNEAMSTRKNCIQIPYFRDDVEKTWTGLKQALTV